ncbi:nucleoid-associated protein [Rudanella paleaurantiibacter]|nr:nucleoid-associated protein [Rudanella paleaurantiibacter]
MHQIFQKENQRSHSTVRESDEVITLSSEVSDIINNRLVNSLGKSSKAFHLDIQDMREESFYGYCTKIEPNDEESFVNASKQIAHKLSKSQTKARIPGGYVIVLDCTHTVKNLPCTIVIKAEPHEAIRQNKSGEKAILEVLNDVILSPSQKLFKIGVLFERLTPMFKNELGDIVLPPNDTHGCMIFDDNFKRATKPAEYFYSDFLGFSVGRNSLIQTKNFFDFTYDFIKQNVTNYKSKEDAIIALKSYLKSNNDPLLNVSKYADDFLPVEVKSAYKGEALQHLPSAFIKETSLIQKDLETKKINFPNKVTISLPEAKYGESVKVITPDDINIDEVMSGNCTYIRIQGKPYESSREV